MRIALNLLYLLPGVVGGTETYATSLIRALAAVDRENEYLLFLNREAEHLPLAAGPNFTRVVCPLRARRRAVRYAWEQAVLPRQLHRHRVDLVHSLGYVGPWWPPCAHVVSIYDLNYLRQGESMPRLRRYTLGMFVEGVAARADHVLTTSAFSRREILTHLKLDPARVTVIPAGARETGPAADEPRWDVLEARYGIRRPYLVAFSSQSPHKNIPRLIRAFARVADEVPHSLVLLGHVPGDGTVREEIHRQRLADRVCVTGYVADEHVLPLLRHAELFVFPSLYEGFGLPVLDAQAVGVPVACSTAGALPEVAGEGAAFFDPRSEEEMSAVVLRCLREPQLRATLVAKGAANRARFSWEAAARATRAVYHQAAAQRARRRGKA